jgi:hypothetical protein
MHNIFKIITIITLGILLWYSLPIFADALSIPWEGIISKPSIIFESTQWDAVSVIQGVGFKILGFLKMFISWIALIYLVMIGVYMVVFSENEEKIKTQRKQITYALIGFLFLNIPWLIYTAFLPDQSWGKRLDDITWWTQTDGSSALWDSAAFGYDGIFWSIISFLKIFIFWVAIIMFTWWLFRMIVSGGDEEIQKQAKHRLIYGTLGLIFLWFVEWWSLLIANGDFTGKITEVWWKLFGIALFFAAPIAVFFLIWWSYYYITSAGDEERVKKWKTIIVNTFIATLILIASLSFMTDLVTFNL